MAEEPAGAPLLDLRLLLPCLAAWALGAWALSWSGAVRAQVATLALLLVLGLWVGGVRYRGRHARASWRRDGPAVLGLALVAAGLVLGSSAVHEATRRVGPVDRLVAERAMVRAEGVVLTEPIVRAGRASGDEGSPAPDQVLLRVRLESVTARGVTTRVRAPVFVRAGQPWGEVGWHDRIALTGRLAPAEPADPEIAVLSPRGPPRPLGERSPVRAAAEHLRSGMREAMEPLPADARGLLPALVIGDTSMTPQDLTDDMLLVGMSHLSAVSGSNVAVVLAALIGTARLGGLPRRWRPWAAGAGLAFFVVLARPEPSVIRAATMGAIGLLGMSTSRRGAGTPALCAAVLALLTYDPWLARSYGFVLSTLATLGLLLFVRPWSDAINAHLPRRLHLVGPAVAIPVAAQLVCGPVIVLLQGDVSLIAVVANLAAAPFVAPATVLGVSAALVAVASTTLASLVGWCGAPFALAIAWTARIAADVPGGALPWPDGPPGAVLLTVVTALGILSGPWAVRRSRASPLVALGLVVVIVVGSLPARTLSWPPPDWRLVACDVGQGDGLVLASGPGRAVLVDVGPEDGGIDACLRRLRVRTLDAVVLTHFHDDHVGDLEAALDGRAVGRILVTPVEDPQWAARQVRRIAGEHGVPVEALVAGRQLTIGEVRADVWWPARVVAGGSAANNASIVLHVRVGEVSMLLLGDIEREVGHALLLALRRDPAMAAAAADLDVVKMPHHGSGNVDEDFMDEVAAPTAIISVGADNTYGHPTPTALQWAARHGTRVLRTDEDGDVAVVDGAATVTAR
ncbi:ComEC/Rec2 family competence protein [Janibacter terrae]|uniref:ComEC/Rec2 family competence protein n=1 Tax=Janibacter terrae TaxID=103817 RepID=UPI000838A6BD|nr:ComEC/Rec2 family competence protein [Janibacter terrae]